MIGGVIEWWTDLTPASQFFWTVAVFATVMQFFMLLGVMVGGAPDLDHGADFSDASTDVASGIKLVSMRVIIAFGIGFGWAGVLALREGWPLWQATLAALSSGLVFMGLVYGAMRLLFSMRDDGTLDYRNALGLTGKVYVTIPARRGGVGQIELMIQGRLITAQAVSDGEVALHQNDFVKVTAVEGQTTLVVAPAH
jgi:membrane protein implicated in regulation of membrane protease activity